MKNKYKIFVFIFILLNLEISYCTTPADFLLINPSASSTGLGLSGVSYLNSTASAYFNPALLLELNNKTQIEFMHNEMIDDLNYEYFGLAMPLKKSNLVFFVTNFHTSFQETDIFGSNKGKVKVSHFSYQLSGAIPIRKNLSLGIGIKHLRLNLIGEKAVATAFDIGYFYKIHQYNLNLGLSINNIGNKLKFVSKKEEIPRIIRIGISQNYFLDRKLFTTAEYVIIHLLDDYISLGLGYEFTPNFIIRTGYSNINDEGNGFTFGMGFITKTFKFDFAYMNMGDLGENILFSLTF